MRIGIDCRTVTSPKTGDRTYALNLIRALTKVDQESDYLLYTTEPTDLTRLPRATPIVLPSSPRWAWTPFAFPRDLKRRKAVVAHVQYIIPPSAPCPVITTIHDISFKVAPALFPLKHRLLLNALIPFSARRAAAVITGSEATKRDLIQHYRLPPEKIFITPYAADRMFRPINRKEAQAAVKERLGIPVPYLLAVGVIQPRKNLPRLVRAYNRIASHVEQRLVIVGKEGWEQGPLKEAVAGSPAGKEPIFTGYVDDDLLPALYSGADLFAFPSLYEGFGLPVLEAMACGTAVLTSNVSSLPEVAGDAAMLVDPHDESALAEALKRLLTDSGERDRVAALGPDQAAKFDWLRTARATEEVYRCVRKRG